MPSPPGAAFSATIRRLSGLSRASIQDHSMINCAGTSTRPYTPFLGHPFERYRQTNVPDC
jgi:hypothetical protein